MKLTHTLTLADVYTHLHNKEGPQYTTLLYAGKKLPNTLDRVLTWWIDPQLPLRASLGGLSGGMKKKEDAEKSRNEQARKASKEDLMHGLVAAKIIGDDEAYEFLKRHMWARAKVAGKDELYEDGELSMFGYFLRTNFLRD